MITVMFFLSFHSLSLFFFAWYSLVQASIHFQADWNLNSPFVSILDWIGFCPSKYIFLQQLSFFSMKIWQHFYHTVITVVCTVETVTHSHFKTLDYIISKHFNRLMRAKSSFEMQIQLWKNMFYLCWHFAFVMTFRDSNSVDSLCLETATQSHSDKRKKNREKETKIICVNKKRTIH